MAEDCPFGALHPDAPVQTAQFAFLIGEWTCSIRRMAPDGALGEPRFGRWTGRYVLDGWAIQDEWISTDAEGNTFPGMNVRSFDRDRKKWHNRWLAAGSLEWLYFEAEQRGDQMVMTSDERQDASGRRFVARNVFYDIGPDAWKWRHDRSFDGGKTWLEGVAVIEARRKAGCDPDDQGPEPGLGPDAPVGN